MSRVVFVHIGAPKTGTTYVQERLALNARSLAAHDVHFPSSSSLSPAAAAQFRAALDLLGRQWGGPPGHVDGAWPALVRRVNARSGTVIISHEILAPAPPEKIRRLVSDLEGPGSQVHVVYSARDLGRQLPAAWQESIKQGRTWSYASFLGRVERGRTWFHRAFDLPSVLGTWGAELPAGRVHLVTVPPRPSGSAGRGTLLWERMCEAFRIDPSWAPLDSVQSNRSLGIAETQVIRKLNRRLDGASRRRDPYDKLIRQMLAQDELAHRPSVPLRLPPQRQAWAEAQADRWIDWLGRSGVEVIGDPDDLRPRPLAEDEVWEDPDQSRPKQQLAVALDALAVMTREAASRPDPEHRVASRLRRVSERWRRG